ncbi:hypothetical protein FACS1894133_0570 [Clostridia bacterium]|nr:hypothetical protein FACS1894133_0220 [Clostridia bacterium]GHU57535.1 hypothetical protein FACS1894133_0570 [Clostridia bacterium]
MTNFIRQLVTDISANIGNVPASVIEIIVTVTDVAVKLIIIYIAWKLLRGGLRRIEKTASERLIHTTVKPIKQLLPLGRTLAVAAFCVLGALFLFSDGIGAALQTVLTTSGIAAVVLGIACQDTLGNLFAGLVLIVTRPFKIGDTIQYVDKGITGVVETITFRHTVIRTFENKQLIIPNSTIGKNIIENFTSGDPRITLLIDFAIEYDSDYEAQIALIANAAETREHTENVRVHIDDMGESAVILRLRVTIPELSNSIQVKNDIYLAVSRAYKAEGFSFAFPSVTVYKAAGSTATAPEAEN